MSLPLRANEALEEGTTARSLTEELSPAGVF